MMNIETYIEAIPNTLAYLNENKNNAYNNINRKTAFRKRLGSLKKEYKNIASDTITINSGVRI